MLLTYHELCPIICKARAMESHYEIRSGEINESDFDFKATRTASSRKRVPEKSNLAVGAICTTTPMGLFLLLPIEHCLPPLIYNHLLRNFPCPNWRTTSLTPVCIASPTLAKQPQIATNRHESRV